MPVFRQQEYTLEFYFFHACLMLTLLTKELQICFSFFTNESIKQWTRAKISDPSFPVFIESTRASPGPELYGESSPS